MTRTVVALLLIAMLIVISGARGALAASAWPAVAGADAPADPQTVVDDNDDTRVEVQLVVLGIVIGAVFVLGSVIYLVRRRLGLVPPPPDQNASGHH
jgi:hypothetical protein